MAVFGIHLQTVVAEAILVVEFQTALAECNVGLGVSLQLGTLGGRNIPTT